jgi:hypothetical protein
MGILNFKPLAHLFENLVEALFYTLFFNQRRLGTWSLKRPSPDEGCGHLCGDAIVQVANFEHSEASLRILRQNL